MITLIVCLRQKNMRQRQSVIKLIVLLLNEKRSPSFNYNLNRR